MREAGASVGTTAPLYLTHANVHVEIPGLDSSTRPDTVTHPTPIFFCSPILLVLYPSPQRVLAEAVHTEPGSAGGFFHLGVFPPHCCSCLLGVELVGFCVS